MYGAQNEAYMSRSAEKMGERFVFQRVRRVWLK